MTLYILLLRIHTTRSLPTNQQGHLHGVRFSAFEGSLFVLEGWKRWMKASATSSVTVQRRSDKEAARRGEEGRRRDGWTWLGGVFLVPGFRLLGREARGSFCSPRRRIRRPTLSPPTRSNSLPPASAALPPYPVSVLPLLEQRALSCRNPRCATLFYPNSSLSLLLSAPPTPPTSARAMVDHV